LSSLKARGSIELPAEFVVEHLGNMAPMTLSLAIFVACVLFGALRVESRLPGANGTVDAGEVYTVCTANFPPYVECIEGDSSPANFSGERHGRTVIADSGVQLIGSHWSNDDLAELQTDDGRSGSHRAMLWLSFAVGLHGLLGMNNH
jgi:hypothetical protein